MTVLIAFALCFKYLIIGMIYSNFTIEKTNSIFVNFIAGLMISMSIFQIVVIPSTFLRMDFDVFKRLYFVIIILLILLSIGINWRRMYSGIKASCVKIIKMEYISHVWEILLCIVIIFMFIFQVYSLHFYQWGVGGDDAFFVSRALTTIESNSLSLHNPYTGLELEAFLWRYVLSPYAIYHSFLSELTSIHPAILTRIVFPIVLLFFVISVYYCIGESLYQSDKKNAIRFVYYSTLVFAFSGIFIGSYGYFGILYLHMGKSLLYVGLIPMCFYMYTRLFWQEQQQRADWILLFALMLASALASSMSIILMTICVGIFGLIRLIVKKDIRNTVYLAITCVPNLIFSMLHLLNTNQLDISIPVL